MNKWKSKPIGDGSRFEPGRVLVAPWEFDSPLFRQTKYLGCINKIMMNKYDTTYRPNYQARTISVMGPFAWGKDIML